MYNSIYFRRAGKVFIDAIGETLGVKYDGVPFGTLAAVDANLRGLGYALSDDFAKAMSEYGDERDFSAVMNEIAREAKNIKGVRDYRAMYPNFPLQVMEASDAELYWNAIMHYTGDVVGWRIMPNYDKQLRPTLKGEHEVKFIDLGSFENFLGLMASLASSKAAFSEQDRQDLGSLKHETLQAVVRRVESFQNRENKAWLAAEMHKRGLSITDFKFDTATDVLRFAVALSDGDVSLAEKTKFKSFKRADRRGLVRVLNSLVSPAEDMMRHQSAWKALLKNLHVGEFDLSVQLKYAIDAVRGQRKVESFNARVERMLAERDVEVITLLATRPGELVRRLDKVARTFSQPDQFLHLARTVSDVANQASATVLLQAYNHFNYRQPLGVYFPKGQVAKMQVMERSHINRDDAYVLAFTLREALIEKFKELPSMGNVYIDPALRVVAVPFGLRNASKGRVLGRGSRLLFNGDTNVLRFFIWWSDIKTDSWGGRVDIDLSASLYNDKFEHVEDIAYHNLRGSGAVHSGDITSAPDGASEFIDIDIETLRERGVRYVSMIVNSYTGQTFEEVPECLAGFMERNDLKSGEIYDPRTVAERVDLTSKSRGATPVIFDLETREAIWVDLTFKIEGGGWNSRTLAGQSEKTLKALTGLMPPSLYDLFAFHATARGLLVRDPARADVVFDLDTAYEVEKILSEYL